MHPELQLPRRLILYCTLCCLLGLLHIGLCKDCYDIVISCPMGQTAWERRRHEYNCTAAGREYVCMMISNGSLAEACMIRYLVGVQQGKCPYIERCDPNHGPVLRMNSYTKCLYEGPECPGKDDVREFYVQDINKYPACIEKKIQMFQSDPLRDCQAGTSTGWMTILCLIMDVLSRV